MTGNVRSLAGKLLVLSAWLTAASAEAIYKHSRVWPTPGEPALLATTSCTETNARHRLGEHCHPPPLNPQQREWIDEAKRLRHNYEEAWAGLQRTAQAKESVDASTAFLIDQARQALDTARAYFSRPSAWEDDNLPRTIIELRGHYERAGQLMQGATPGLAASETRQDPEELAEREREQAERLENDRRLGAAALAEVPDVIRVDLGRNGPRGRGRAAAAAPPEFSDIRDAPAAAGKPLGPLAAAPMPEAGAAVGSLRPLFPPGPSAAGPRGRVVRYLRGGRHSARQSGAESPAASIALAAASSAKHPAFIHFESGSRLETAADAAELAGEESEESAEPPAPASPAQPLIDEAWRRVRAGDNAGAEAAAREAVRADPKNAAALEVLALALIKQGRYDEANRVASEALALAPISSNAWAFRAYAKDALGDFEGAITDLQKAARLEPAYADQLWRARTRGRISADERPFGARDRRRVRVASLAGCLLLLAFLAWRASQLLRREAPAETPPSVNAASEPAWGLKPV